LLAYLESVELTKDYQLKSTHEIWKCLTDEYDPVSDFRRAQATLELYTLQKKPSTSMQEHINEFTHLQQEVDYHRDNIPPLTNDEVNLTFLKSLDENWKTFQQSMSPHLHSMSLSQLFDEVLVFDSKIHLSASESIDPKALSTHFRKYPSKHQSPHHNKPYNCPDNPSLFYHYCKRKRHMIDDCLKKRWRDTQANEDIDMGDVEHDWKQA